jgi:uncharacterized protein (TIGR04255 family)
MLRPDAIIEAVLEIRFDAPEGLPELFFGRLCEVPEWKAFQQMRLPAYEIPPSLRTAQPMLRFQPVLQLLDAGDAPRMVRMGPQVLSYHRQVKYVGWAQFQPELNFVVERLFKAAPGITVTRLGLRYMNAFTGAAHGVMSMQALHMDVNVAGESIHERINVNYTRAVPGVGECAVRIATPDFVAGPLPEGATVFVDVDVYTLGEAVSKSAIDVHQWIDQAHKAEKDEFFHLLTQKTIDSLNGELNG